MDLGHPGWNDIVADGRGNIYVNGAGFNPAAGQESRPGAVYHVAADGPVRQVAGDIAFPNRMTVIAADLGRPRRGNPGRHLRRLPGHRLVRRRAGRRCVRVAAGGTMLDTVELDRGGFACVLGGPRRTTLFITAAEWRGMTESQMVTPGSGQVLAVEVDVPGAGWP